MTVSPKTLLLLEERSGGMCEMCGRQWATNTHHRRSRGMGGSRDPLTNDVSNLLRLCGSGTTGCHGWIEGNRTYAYNHGLLVRRTATDPSSVAVRLHLGTVLLTRQGEYLAVDEPVVP